MPPPPRPLGLIGGILRVTVVHQVGRGLQRNVFHLRSSTGEWPAEFIAEVGEAFRTWYSDGLLGAAPPTLFMSEATSPIFLVVRSAPLPGITNFTSTLIAMFGITGGVGQPGTAANSTIALQWFTARGGRRGRGRTYLCGLTSNVYEENDATTIKPLVAGTILDCYDALRVGLASWGGTVDLFRLCVFHRDGLGSDPNGDRWYTPIVGCRFADLALDSQKGRLPGHVHH